ncbi:MAG: aldehyde ferredoxin oxidoreductase [Desulfobacterales bacterium]|nr:aldehyde ferredoxin oxidoreductase [Desulfobacterales bacterium]
MIRDHFRVLHVELESGRGKILEVDGRDRCAGGSGLAAQLFATFGLPEARWDDPRQPIIFAIGPLTGLFPLMSKTVCAFKSPYHDQYAESHAGGRSALALRFADLDALVVTGRAPTLSCLSIGSRRVELKDVHYMRGFDIHRTGKLFRRMFPGAGHRSILRIGPAGEALSAMACVVVDTYRHFGRLGPGAAMGAKQLKGIAIQGDASFPLPPGKDYPKLFQEIYRLLTDTEMMHKYHNLGTAENVVVLNAIHALPLRNLQRTSDPAATGISGEAFAEKALLRNAACAGCPVGCIHIGFVREKFMDPNQYLYRQVSYDHEPVFAVGGMLAVHDPFAALGLMEAAEGGGLDVMSAGVALAWATEATEKGLIGTAETIIPLGFGNAGAYREALGHLARRSNEFYTLLGSGTLQAARRYGGEDFACVLGQEMAGYATGEAFFVSQALGLRHSHLDAGGYAFDQKQKEKDVAKAVDFLVADEAGRCLLTSMVACLFARGVYTEARLAEALASVGYAALAAATGPLSTHIQRERWRVRVATGYRPENVPIPKRFREVVTWKGPIDADYLERLRVEYGRRIRQLAEPPPPSAS